MTGWDGVSDFYEDDEPLEAVRAIVAAPADTVTAQPPTVLDVAERFLSKLGRMDTWRLQKLCYYAQAEHLVRTGQPLFRERIEAWANGPVVRALWQAHKYRREVATVKGDADVVSRHPTAGDTVDIVADRFGGWSGVQLSELSHREGPWLLARAGLPPRASSDREIPIDHIAGFYASLQGIPEDGGSPDAL